MFACLIQRTKTGASSFSIFLACALLTCLPPVTCFAIQSDEFDPLESDRIVALRKTLGKTCSLSLKNSSLRSSRVVIEREYGVRIWLDANIDLDATYDYVASSTTLASALDGLASSRQTTIVWLGDVLYFAPESRAGSIESAYWRVLFQWPEEDRTATAFEWSSTASPVEILSSWANQNGWTIRGLDRIDYDLWSAGSLPAMHPAAQLQCLLGGLEMEAKVERSTKTLEIIPLGPAEAFSVRYASDRIDLKAISKWKQDWPEAKLQSQSKTHTILAVPQAHRALAGATLTPKRTTTNAKDPLANEQFTFQFKGRVVAVLEELRKGPKLEFTPWPLEQSVQDRQVVCDFKKVSIDKILETLGSQANLDFQRVGLKVNIQVR
jgi:hypothetical protein